MLIHSGMGKIRIYSWNVNGIRAVFKKGFEEWVAQMNPDILCLQETKISSDFLTPEISELEGYESHWSHAEKKGYSGVSVYSKHQSKGVNRNLGVKEFDSEGRVLELDFGHFTLLNVYFPNGKASIERLAYKLAFYEHFLGYVLQHLANGTKLVICGDVNTAHKAIDLARPKQNVDVSGFLPEEREWMDRFTNAGFIDTFRYFHNEPDRYSWWSFRSGARERNVGWRIDYFFVSSDLENHLRGADIHEDIMGSDHCPVSLELEF